MRGGGSVQTESFEIHRFDYHAFQARDIEGLRHVKRLGFLSVVQAETGSYDIQLDHGSTFHTGEGGIFIAPSVALQTITHHVARYTGLFRGRYFFLDVTVNGKYHLEDLWDFPAVTDAAATETFRRDFDRWEQSDGDGPRTACMFSFLSHLLELGTRRAYCRNRELYPLLEYIRLHYAQKLTVADMAALLNISESGLYAAFKSAMGTSPLRYLNDYRLTVARELLLHSDRSVKAVAEAVGIPDPFYFSRLFRSAYGQPPQTYRRGTYY